MNNICQECGYKSDTPAGEYHPYEYCQLVKAGIALPKPRLIAEVVPHEDERLRQLAKNMLKDKNGDKT
jgi:hypothetical protein